MLLLLVLKSFSKPEFHCPTGKDDHKLHVRRTMGIELESDEEVEYFDAAEIEPAIDI